MPACSFWRQIVLSWIVNRTIALGHRAVRLYQYQLLPSRSGSCKACHRRTAEHFFSNQAAYWRIVMPVPSFESSRLIFWQAASFPNVHRRNAVGKASEVFVRHGIWCHKSMAISGTKSRGTYFTTHTYIYLYTYCLCKGYVREYLKKYSLIWYNIFNLGSWNSHRPKEASRETPSYGWVQ